MGRTYQRRQRSVEGKKAMRRGLSAAKQQKNGRVRMRLELHNEQGLFDALLREGDFIVGGVHNADEINRAWRERLSNTARCSSGKSSAPSAGGAS